MKKLVIFLFCLSAFNWLSAQQVGIGQPQPASKLDVNGNLTIGENFSGTLAPEGGALIEGAVGLSVDSAAMDTSARLHLEYSMVDTATMALFRNNGEVGVAIAGINSDSLSGFNGVEGVTSYIGQSFTPSGVFGLAIAARDTSLAIGVRGATNNDLGVGVLGTRLGTTDPLSGGGFGGLFLNAIGFSGGFWNVSDSRLKKDVQPIENALGKLMQVDAVQYQFNLKKYPYLGLGQGNEMGLLAQQLETVFPEMVTTKRLDMNACLPVTPGQPHPSNIQEVKMVDYLKMIPVLIKSIQEQQEIIEELKQEVEALKQSTH